MSYALYNQTQFHQSKMRKRHPHRMAHAAVSAADRIGDLQKAYGNRSVQRMANAVNQELTGHFSFTDGLKKPYRAAAEWLASRAREDGMSEQMKAFARLTPPQKQAVLHELGVRADWSNELVLSELNRKLSADGEMKWEQIEHWIHSVQGVRLEHKEVTIELDNEPDDAEIKRYRFDASGLVSVYKDIALWLSYKANKQRQVPFMQLFRSLSLIQQKAAIHMMARSEQLKFRSFTERMSKVIQFKKSVDWEAAYNALRKVRMLAKKQDDSAVRNEQEELSPSTASGKHVEQSGDELSSFLSDMLGLGAAALALTDDNERQEESENKSAQAEEVMSLTDERSIAWLLSGMRGVTSGALAVMHFVKSSSRDKQKVVDRYLKIPERMPHDKKAKLRKQKLTKAGFQSVDQCFEQIMKKIAEYIDHKVSKDKDAAYKKLFADLGETPSQNTSKNVENIFKQLHNVKI